MKQKRSQAALEATLSYTAGAMLLGAAIYIWAWGNAQLPLRQLTFEGTRQAAGMGSRTVDENGAQRGSKGLVYPVYHSAPIP